MNLRLSRHGKSRARAAGLLVLCGCGRHAGGDAADSAAVARVSATVVEVATRPFVETVGVIGVVTPRAGHIAALSAPAPTRVVAVLVSAGDHVQEGQRLIELDAGAFTAAMQSANAAVDAARQARDRAQRLVTEGISARRDLEQADADLARMRADSGTAARVVERAVLRAPIAGVVTQLNAALGASVDVNQPLIEIADPSDLDAIVTVTPIDAARIHVTDGAMFHEDHGQDLASGVVADVGGAMDTTSHGVPVRITVTHSRRPLRIGETLAGVITVGTRRNAIVIPVAALVPVEDGFQVFVVDTGGVAHATAVTVGGRTDSLAEILSGVATGQRVVTTGAFGVEDGAHIIVPRP